MDCLLRATAKVIEDVGWQELSTNRVAKLAGVSIGSLYRYFPNRESLGRGLVHKIWEDETVLILQAAEDLGAESAPFEHLTRTYVRYVSPRSRLYAEWSSHLVEYFSDDPAPWDARVLDLLVQIFDACYEDHPRKRGACEVAFASVVLVTRRAARTSPVGLADGTIERELVALVRSAFAAFTPRPRVAQ